MTATPKHREQPFNLITFPILANRFALTGVIFGLPSFPVLLLDALNIHLNAGASSGSNLGKTRNILLLLLQGMTGAIGALRRATGSLGQVSFTLAPRELRFKTPNP